MTVQKPMGSFSSLLSSLSKGRHDGIRRSYSDEDILPPHEHPSVHKSSHKLRAAE